MERKKFRVIEKDIYKMNTQNIPRLIFWELTKQCNLACVHCRAEAADIDFSGELGTQTIKGVIDDIVSFATPILVLTGGEPLYREDVFEIASYASEKGLRVALATNGTLIDRKMASRIKNAGIARVSISIDGRDASSHDGFRGVPGSFDKALEGTVHLNNEGVDFQFNSTITKRNIDQIEDMLELAEKKGAKAVHLFMLVPVGCGIQIADTDMLPAEKYEETLRWFYERSKQTDMEFKATCAPHYYRIIREEARKENRKINFQQDGMAAMTRGCLAGSGVCFISHTGDVQPCGYLPLVAGNVTQNKFKAIWESSELFNALRDTRKLKGKCGQCEYKKVCGGCRARAYFASNDYLDEEPYCVYLPNEKAYD